jgi:hypothetical protein
LELNIEAMQKHHRTTVFISYSHEDTKWRKQLCQHLEPLCRDRNISIWDDTEIRTGEAWREEVEKAIKSSAIAVLLISKHYFSSGFISSIELPLLLAVVEKKRTRIMQVIIGVCNLPKELSRLQSVNLPTEPLEGMPEVEQDKVFVKLCKEIKSQPDDSSPERRQPQTKPKPQTTPKQIHLNGFAYPRPKWISRVEEKTITELAKAAFVLTAFERTETGCWGKTYLHRLKLHGDKLPLSGGALTGVPFALVALHSYAGKQSAALIEEWSRYLLTETLTKISRPGGGYEKLRRQTTGGVETEPEEARHEAGGCLITLLLGNYGTRDKATLESLCCKPGKIPYDKATISRALLQASYSDSVEERLRRKAADRQLKLLRSLIESGKQAKPCYIWATVAGQSDATFQWGTAWYLLPSIVSPKIPPESRRLLESLLRNFLHAQSAAESTGGNLLPQGIDETGHGWGKQVFGSAVALVCWRTLEWCVTEAATRSSLEEARRYAGKMVRRLVASSPDVLELPCTDAEQKNLEGYLGWAGICLAAATLGIRLHHDDCRKGLDLVEGLNDLANADLSQEVMINRCQKLIQRKELFAPATTWLIARCAARISSLYRFVQRVD